MISSSSSSSSSQTPIVGCISILKQTYDANGNPLNPVAPFIFQIDNGPLVSNDANGYARFDNVPVGMHTITEIPQSGWNQILVTPQNGQVSVSGGSLCAGILFRNQQTNGGQNVVIGNNSNTPVNPTINAVSGNSTTINQNGSGDQNAAVGNGANTSVNSTINAASGNNTNVTQDGNGSNGQTVIDLNNGNTGVNNTINGASGNQTTVNQTDNGGIGTQNAGVANSAGTNVNNTINALSGNATNVTQNDTAPMQLTPLFANAPQAQAQPMTPPANTMTAAQQQNLLSSILSMLSTLQQQLASLFGSH